MLSKRAHTVPICADESAHDRKGLHALKGRYDVVNIKLDKTGGLTEALAMKQAAREAGFGVFVGCMMGSSLAMAPATLAAQDADYVDLDAPLLLEEDRTPALTFNGSTLNPPTSDLWG
jgi:L-alanine-DL-glutamate epimerase-like enolase superfamily enzyme